VHGGSYLPPYDKPMGSYSGIAPWKDSDRRGKRREKTDSTRSTRGVLVARAWLGLAWLGVASGGTMASWFRSKDMTYVSIIVNEDAAHTCISDLGRMDVLQVVDLNPGLTPFQRRYVSYIKRIDELERKVKYFAEEMGKFGIKAQSAGPISEFVKVDAPGGGSQVLDDLESQMSGAESQLLELNRFSARLTAEYNEKVEFQVRHAPSSLLVQAARQEHVPCLNARFSFPSAGSASQNSWVLHEPHGADSRRGAGCRCSHVPGR
jgi:hypothetical protein